MTHMRKTIETIWLAAAWLNPLGLFATNTDVKGRIAEYPKPHTTPVIQNLRRSSFVATNKEPIEVRIGV